MGIVDTIIVGRVGTSEQGGVGMGASLYWTLICLFTGTISATNTFVAQSFGAGKLDTIRLWVLAPLLLVVPMSLILLPIIPYLDPIMELLGTTSEVRPHVEIYMVIRFWGTPFILSSFIFSSFLRGLGDMKTPMLVTLVSNVANIGLDLLLVFGWGPIPAYGVAGAAWATVLASLVSSGMYLMVYLGKKNNALYKTRSFVRVPKEMLLRYLKVGLPLGGTWFIESISWSVMTFYIAGIAPAALAAHTIVFQMIHFSFMPAIGLSVASSTLVGQYLGAERVDLAKKSARVALVWSCGFMTFVGLMFALMRTWLVGLFNSDPEVILIGGRLMLVAAAFQLFDAMGLTAAGVLRGAGDTRFPLYAQLGAAWLVFAPLILLLGDGLGWGIYGAWIAALIFIVLLAGLFYGRYLGGKWQSMRVH